MTEKPLDWRGKTREGAIATIVGSVLVLQANAKRSSALLVNDGANWIYLSRSAQAAINQGIPLAPNGGFYEINSSNLYYGPISMACAVAAQNLCWNEGE